MRRCFFVLLLFLCGCDFFGTHTGKEQFNIDEIRIAGIEQLHDGKNIKLNVYLGSTSFELLDAYRHDEFLLCTSDGLTDFSLESDALSYDTDTDALWDVVQEATEDERISLLIFSLPADAEDGRAMILADNFFREFYLELER